MKRSKVAMAAFAGLAAAAAVLAACSGGIKELDVVGRQSIASFGEIMEAMPDAVAADEMNAGWALDAPDGSARFIWSGDYAKSPLHDVMIEFDAKPFLDAGLDTGKLPESHAVYGGRIMVGAKLGEAGVAKDRTAMSAYEFIVENHRDSIGYHTTLDHYGVKLGGGNMFEWANDMAANGYDGSAQDKDIVFVLNPEPLIAAGANPEKVEGWAYAQVLVEENGKQSEVWKLLKPFDLK